MTEQEREEANNAKGYFLAGITSQGHEIWRSKNTEVGGWIYWSDACGAVFPIWDTAIHSLPELEIIRADLIKNKL